MRELKSLPNEIWKDIPGWEGDYMASSYGRIVSLPHPQRPVYTILKGFSRSKAVHRLIVNLVRRGRVYQASTASLVALAFIGPKPKGLFVCHNDGSSYNNSAINLRYDTPKANMKDKKLHGTQAFGEAVSNSKLNDDKAEKIRKLVNEYKLPAWMIAKHFGVGKTTVHNIAKGKSWNKANREFNTLDEAHTNVLAMALDRSLDA